MLACLDNHWGRSTQHTGGLAYDVVVVLKLSSTIVKYLVIERRKIGPNSSDGWHRLTFMLQVLPALLLTQEFLSCAAHRLLCLLEPIFGCLAEVGSMFHVHVVLTVPRLVSRQALVAQGVQLAVLSVSLAAAL